MNGGHSERESLVLIGFSSSVAASGRRLAAVLSVREHEAVKLGNGQGANAFPQIRTTSNCSLRIHFDLPGDTARRVGESCLNPFHENMPWAQGAAGA